MVVSIAAGENLQLEQFKGQSQGPCMDLVLKKGLHSALISPQGLGVNLHFCLEHGERASLP